MNLHNPKTTKITEIHFSPDISAMWFWREKGTSGYNTYCQDYAPSARNIARILRVLANNPDLINELTVIPNDQKH